jgi:hypothetical protein
LILAYQEGRLSLSQRARLLLHFSECDFCGAERQFFEKHPPCQEDFIPAAVPLNLLCLAEQVWLCSSRAAPLAREALEENDWRSLLTSV